MSVEVIQVCYAIHDQNGLWSRLVGTSLTSLLMNNTDQGVAVHILHDKSLAKDNQDRLLKIGEEYGAGISFHSMPKLFPHELEKIEGHLAANVKSRQRFSAASLYRLLAVGVLPEGCEKLIYLDGDTLVCGDIFELWQVSLGDFPLAAVPEVEITKVKLTLFDKPLLRQKLVAPENYFNAGVLLLNVSKIREMTGEFLDKGLEILTSLGCRYGEQDILNYFFSGNYLHLSSKFNTYVDVSRFLDKQAANFTFYKNLDHLHASIYHFVSHSLGCCKANDRYDNLFFKYYVKTPWFDYSSLANCFTQWYGVFANQTNRCLGIVRAIIDHPAYLLVDKQFFNSAREAFPNLEYLLIENEEQKIFIQPLVDLLSQKSKTVFIICSRAYEDIKACLVAHGYVEGVNFVDGSILVVNENGSKYGYDVFSKM